MMNEENKSDVEVFHDVEVEPTKSQLPTKLTHKSIAEMKNLDEFKKQLVKEIMKKGEHGTGADYGSTPGIKMMIFKEGIQTIKEAFNLTVGVPKLHREIIPLKLSDGTIVNHIGITAMIPIHSLETGAMVGSGLGHCATIEDKYRYRGEERKCPECNGAFIIKGKSEYGGGWLCYKKKGGCGAKFNDEDTRITEQPIGRIENTNPHNVLNTVIGMSVKRGRSPGVLDTTGMDKYFRLPEDDEDEGPIHEGSAEYDEKKKTENKYTQKKAPEKKEVEAPSKDALESLETDLLDYFGSGELADAWLFSTTNQERDGVKYKGIKNFSDIKSIGLYKMIRAEFNKIRKAGEFELK